MAAEPLYIDLFTAALAHTRPVAFDECLKLAEAAGPRAAGLTGAQISGLLELANTAPTIDNIREEVIKREGKRWKKKGKPGPGDQLVRDIESMRRFANEAVRSAEEKLGRALGDPEAGKRPAGRNWVNELHLALARRYLVAVATLARIKKATASPDTSEEEN